MGSRRRSVLIAATVGTAFALVYLTYGFRYPMGKPNHPGPGVFPLLVGLVLLLGCLGTGMEALLRRTTEKVLWPKGPDRLRMLSILAAVIGYVLLLPYLGYPLNATLLSLTILQVMGLRKWPVKAGLALGIGLGSYILGRYLLGIPMPTGILFD